MIVQACINGARPAGFHPSLPLTAEAMIEDALHCLEAGASELHIHPRGADGNESLGAVDALMTAVRRTCPGALVGISTGAWIEGDAGATRDRIAAWTVPPDYASVNLCERDAPAVMDLLMHRGVGVEAGLATVEDALRFVALPECGRVFRVLVEIEEQKPTEADRVANGVLNVLRESGVERPMLLHGFDDTVWRFVRRARALRLSTRIGLEDGRLTPDGAVASGNAELVAEAVRIFRGDRTVDP